MNQSLEGIFGETGPFASAGCINPIYKQNQSEVDQEKP